ncbi:MAG: hypothetical protein SPI12_03310 [Actinomycetaceae bacterium]|nr:hypothetical protein [Actinomycetaceae bacterium]MDY6082874.1 hypothetical protein [Actinomycetaceae bacterium]
MATDVRALARIFALVGITAVGITSSFSLGSLVPTASPNHTAPQDTQPTDVEPTQARSGEAQGEAQELKSVTAWLRTQGLNTLKAQASTTMPRIDAAHVSQLDVGRPMNVLAFPNPGATSLRPVPSQYWAAPIRQNTDVIGAMTFLWHQGKGTVVLIEQDEDFGQMLANPPRSSTIVFDPVIVGWFLISGDGRISPLDTAAENVVAGSVSTDVFASVRSEAAAPANRRGLSQQASTGDTSGGDSSVVWRVALVMAGVLILLGGLVWLMRPEDPRDDGA